MKTKLLKKIIDKEIVVGVVGLGYVGLPLAVEKAKAGFKTIGFDVQIAMKSTFLIKLKSVVADNVLSATSFFRSASTTSPI